MLTTKKSLLVPTCLALKELIFQYSLSAKWLNNRNINEISLSLAIGIIEVEVN